LTGRLDSLLDLATTALEAGAEVNEMPHDIADDAPLKMLRQRTVQPLCPRALQPPSRRVSPKRRPIKTAAMLRAVCEKSEVYSDNMALQSALFGPIPVCSRLENIVSVMSRLLPFQ
jgi:hypothetical protein